MKKKPFIIGLFCIIIIYLLIYFIVPQFGLPSSRYILIMRIERLGKWKEGIQCYIQENNMKPDGLFEVYRYCTDNKKDIDLRLVSLPIASIEDKLPQDKMVILTDKATFNENIEYEFIIKNNIWQIHEKKTYPKYFRERLAIDSRGNILVYPLSKDW